MSEPAGLTIDETVTALMADPDFQALSPIEKAAQLSTVITQQVAPVLARDAVGAPPAPAPALAPTPELEDGYTELGEFLDDVLRLSYQGQHYDLQACDIETGMECQLLLGVAVSGKLARDLTVQQRQRLDDAEERDLFERLLGGVRWLREPLEVDCPRCAQPAGKSCVLLEGDDLEAWEADELAHDGRGEPHPSYDPAHDVWHRLLEERRSWAFVQHVGTTAMYWAAISKQFALEFWLSGGRSGPKEVTSPPPAQPQDRRPPKPRKRASTRTTGRKKAATRATSG